MACDSISRVVTQSQFDELCAKAQAAGLPISGPTGCETASTPLGNVRVEWEYANGTLTLRCVDKPFLVPCSVLNTHLCAILEQDLAGIG